MTKQQFFKEVREVADLPDLTNDDIETALIQYEAEAYSEYDTGEFEYLIRNGLPKWKGVGDYLKNYAGDDGGLVDSIAELLVND